MKQIESLLGIDVIWVATLLAGLAVFSLLFALYTATTVRDPMAKRVKALNERREQLKAGIVTQSGKRRAKLTQQNDTADKVKSFTKEKGMPWQQIYEGKYWETTIGMQFAVEGIPFCLLIDGDTGKILATSAQLRGAALEKTLEKVFANR